MTEYDVAYHVRLNIAVILNFDNPVTVTCKMQIENIRLCYYSSFVKSNHHQMRQILVILYIVHLVLSEGEEETHEHEEHEVKCRGGVVDDAFLEDFTQKTCTIINGDLEMRNLFVTIEALEPLNRIKKIDHGALIFEDNTGFESISFLNSLEEIDNSASEEPAIQISNNVGLLSIGLPALRKVMSGGEGPIVQIYSLNALPAEDDTRFREMTGGRYYMYVHNKDAEESEEDSTGLVVGLVIVGMVVLAIAAGVIVCVIYKKEKQRKMDEAKRPDGASNESREMQSKVRPGSVDG